MEIPKREFRGNGLGDKMLAFGAGYCVDGGQHANIF